MTECWACAAAVDDGRLDVSGYARCGRCGLRFFPSGAAPREVYDAGYFASYKGGDYVQTEPTRRHEARVRLGLVEALAPARGHLLEIGSATGYFLDEARGRGWTVTGIEPSQEAAAVAHERFGLDVRVGFAEDVALAAGVYDAACLWHVLEHVPRPRRLLEMVRAALRPGAPILIEVPNGASRAARREGAGWFALEPDVHVAQWTPSALSELLDCAGWSGVQTSTVPFLTYVPGATARSLRRVKLALRQRSWARDPHPDAHELLRAAARA